MIMAAFLDCKCISQVCFSTVKPFLSLPACLSTYHQAVDAGLQGRDTYMVQLKLAHAMQGSPQTHFVTM